MNDYMMRKLVKQVLFLLITILFTVMILFTVTTSVGAEPALQPTPVPRQPPRLDIEYLPKLALVELEFTPGNVEFNSGYITKGYSSGSEQAPPGLQVQLLDYVGKIIESFNLYNPLIQDRINPDGTHSQSMLSKAEAKINFAFVAIMKTMRLVDTNNAKTLVEIDLEPLFKSYCLENPNDLDCVADLVPFFFHPGWEIDNPTLSPDMGRLTVKVVIQNIGGNVSSRGVPVLVTLSTDDRQREVLASRRFRITTALLPGQEYTRDVVFMLRNDIPEGLYWLEANVDPNNEFKDLAHSNNVITVHVMIRRP